MTAWMMISVCNSARRMSALNKYLTAVILAVTLLHGQLRQLSAAEDIGLRVPEGFEITRFAGDNLAHDIFCMTIDSLGRVVVSGPGYVRILIDDNNDGIADRAETFVDGPVTGAQGMFFHGRDLILAGGEGLIRYRDRNGDDRADGPPDVFLKIKTGNEHDLHAIRRGPDGYWYVIAGNTANVDEKYAATATSPVKKPHAGVILRLKPDLSEGEIFAHGMRNAYDFDFHLSGEIFAFDSDGENVMNLPWYQPTKLFHVLPGSHQGWVTNNWIRPDHFFDSAPVVSAFGRGSPTGVVCYNHTAFPKRYRGAMFLQDWTFGKVYCLPVTKKDGTFQGTPEEFVTAVGQHGFAPTDIEVGPRGELYFCVGGRGTQGGVYCVRPIRTESDHQTWPEPNIDLNSAEAKVNLCLTAPQPLSSWSRRIWEPVAGQLTAKDFQQAALDRHRPTLQRGRAIEILTEKFGGVTVGTAAQLSLDSDSYIRSRAAWSMGRTHGGRPSRAAMEPFLKDRDPMVVRTALEAMQGAQQQVYDDFVPLIGLQLSNPDRLVRQAASRTLLDAKLETVRSMAHIAFPKGWEASVPVAASYAARTEGYTPYTVDIAVRILKARPSDSIQLEATRLLQLGLGDLVAKDHQNPAVFDGYASKADLSAHRNELEKISLDLLSIYPTKNTTINKEIERVFAMIEPKTPAVLDRVLMQITKETHPVDDIHRLIVAGRIPVQRSAMHSQYIAQALLNIEPKFMRLQLQKDSSWADRMSEVSAVLSDLDESLPDALINTPSFGLPGHILFVTLLGPEHAKQCAEMFLKQVMSNPNYPWTPDLVFMLSATEEPKALEAVKAKFSDLSLRTAILQCIASSPKEADRHIYVEGLDSNSLEAMQLSVEALHFLSKGTDARENILLAKTLRKLGDSGDERMVRDQTVELIRRNLAVKDRYILGNENTPQPEAIRDLIDSVEKRFPKEFAAMENGIALNIEQMKRRLASVNWDSGHAARGHQIYQSRSCTQCHGSSGAIGPDLTGVAGRFSRDDLFTAIVFPSQDISPRYQGMQVITTQGHVRSGMIVYEGLDGLVLRDQNNKTYRIESNEIEDRIPMTTSLMPNGLLDGLTDRDYADLYAYLRSLGAKSTSTAGELPKFD